MNIRRTLLLLGSVFGAISVYAQGGKAIYAKADSVDFSTTQYHYYYEQKSLGEGYDEMVLQVGRRINRFSSEHDFFGDSIAYALGGKLYDYVFLDKKHLEMERKPPRARQARFTILDNYPEGKVSIADCVFMDHHLSVEERTLPEWEIVPDSVQTIAGYPCQLARTHYLGRDWLAWFTESLPHPFGPWLLRGLPGLIVQAYDSTGEHLFLMHTVTRHPQVVTYPDKDYYKSKREVVLKLQARYYDDRVKYIQGTSEGSQTSGLEDVKVDKVPFDPLRLIVAKDKK